MGEQPVSQREFDRYREAVDRELARLGHDLDQLEEQRKDDLKAAAKQRTGDLEATASRKERSWGRLIGLITCATGVVVAWVGLLSLHR